MTKFFTTHLSRIISVLLILSFCRSDSYAQKESNYFVEINLAKLASMRPLFNEDLKAEFSIMNGIKIGKSLGENSEVYLSLMKESSATMRSLIGSYSIFQHQAGIGVNINAINIRKFKIHVGSEFIVNHNRYNGTWESDAPFYFFPLNNFTLLETGLTAQIQVNYLINSRLSIGINSRIGIYNRPNYEIDFMSMSNEFYYHFEPINLLALRINLN